MALAFHHAVLGEQDKARVVIDRIRELVRTGDDAHHADIPHFLAGQPLAGVQIVGHTPRAFPDPTR
ncbi:hypothetical protein [Streptomyces tricolor]|uniref:hypothetical protein n=1 Tax=Streptomyces tricolor TaxID=68277 RepID=UPI003D75C636